MTYARASKSIEFDAGHRVPWHESKCRNPHGHRYTVVATVEGPIRPYTSSPSDAGMVVDFGCIKEILTEYVHDVLDHSFMVWDDDKPMKSSLALLGDIEDVDPRVVVLPCIPTAEELARWVWDETIAAFVDAGVRLVSIELRETPTSIAYYTAATGPYTVKD
jgi:6-pyruvoyltetrahydropterin/6-carboxytetrahydropterin synthase